MPSTESSLLISLGKTVYEAKCATCHGAQGQGKPPHWPPLSNNQSIETESAVNPIRMVLNGGYPPGTAGNPMPYGMPPFAQSLSDDEVAAVVTEDPATLQRDRAQHVFTQTFEQFSGRMISPDRMKKGSAHLVKNATMFERIEREYGVPGPILVAIWGLETDFGVNQGKFQIIRSVATLAHDCRRTDKFQAELMATLRIIESGDMTPAELKGLWAGEIGQTQFLPSSYLDYAVDFDGNGKRDLIHSAPDALAVLLLIGSACH